MTSKLTSKNVASIVGLGALLLMTTTAMAQWQWMDKDGRKVFSDRSPPAEIADKDILKRPAGANRAAATPVVAASGAASAAVKPASAASAAALKASAPKLSGKDAELEAKKKKAEDEDAAKKKVDEEKNAKIKADNCDRAKSGLANLQSGVRISTTNAQGEREILDDTKRALETKRVQDMIDSSCK